MPRDSGCGQVSPRPGRRAAGTALITSTTFEDRIWPHSDHCHRRSSPTEAVGHPTRICKATDGKRSIPTPYDIAGSAHWYNKADNIIRVHRDQAEGTSLVQVWVQQVRLKHIGRVGGDELHYDPITGRCSDPKAAAAGACRAARGGQSRPADGPQAVAGAWCRLITVEANTNSNLPVPT